MGTAPLWRTILKPRCVLGNFHRGRSSELKIQRRHRRCALMRLIGLGNCCWIAKLAIGYGAIRDTSVCVPRKIVSMEEVWQKLNWRTIFREIIWEDSY